MEEKNMIKLAYEAGSATAKAEVIGDQLMDPELLTQGMYDELCFWYFNRSEDFGAGMDAAL